VAIALANVSAGYRGNEQDIFTNKEFTAPAFGESFKLNAFDMIKRMPGQDPYSNPNFAVNVAEKAASGINTVTNKILRAVELMAAEVLTTGLSTFKDAAGNTLFSLDFKPKATHFPTVGTAWSDANADIIGDLKSLADVIREDSLASPDTIIMGAGSFEHFLNNTKVQARINFRRADEIALRPEMRGEGGTFQGRVSIGDYQFDIWTYSGRYVDPVTPFAKKKYIADDKVVMFTSGARLDATWGSVQLMAAPDQRVMRYLPNRLSSSAANTDININGWLSQDNENLEIGVKSRPCLVPTDIDSFGCIDTNP